MNFIKKYNLKFHENIKNKTSFKNIQKYHSNISKLNCMKIFS